MSKIRELITEGFEQYDGAEDVLDLVANYVFRQTTKNDYFGLLMDEVRNADRHRVRGVERAVFGGATPGSHFISERTDAAAPTRRYAKLEDSVSVAKARATWLSERLFVGSNPDATWGSTLIEEHRERADYLRKLAAGNIATAIKHEKVAAFLEEKGARCLDEVDPAELEGLFDE